jgi:hypothetical protein
MEQNNAQGAKQFAQDKVHSQMVKAGGKNYFFDVKKASNGNNYLSINESYKKQDGEKVSNRLVIFKDHVAEFEGALAEAKKFLQ